MPCTDWPRSWVGSRLGFHSLALLLEQGRAQPYLGPWRGLGLEAGVSVLPLERTPPWGRVRLFSVGVLRKVWSKKGLWKKLIFLTFLSILHK